jgi:lipoprotein-anchoring transpeptidase ErfK/SrfK
LGIYTSAKLLGEENGFYKIEYLDITGYVSKEYANPYKREHVNMEPIDAVYFTKEALIYDEAMEAKAIVPKYEFALVYEDNNDTYLVDADGLVGYVDKNVVQHVAEDENYVVVDISDQNVKIYNGTDVLLDTPVVTGRPSSPTKVGYFSVWSDWGMRRLACFGSPWVNVMKKFDQGRGLHDAERYTEENGFTHGWRDSSEFGGNTYLTNGSHGCVNMPHDAAMETDKLVKEGTKVLVKR